MRLLQDMLSNLMRGTMGLSAFGRKDVADLSSEPQQAVKAVLSATGEVSSLVYAENLLNVIEALDDEELAAVLAHLLDTHDINAQALAKAATTYATAPTHGGLEIIANAAEPGWMELFRRSVLFGSEHPPGKCNHVRLGALLHSRRLRRARGWPPAVFAT